MKTAKVKVYGYIDPQGRWYAAGFPNATIQNMDWLADSMPPDGDMSLWSQFCIEADVPIPDKVPQAIAGEVVSVQPVDGV